MINVLTGLMIKTNELAKYENFISKPFLYECYFLMAKQFFITGVYKKALLYSNKIINDIDFKLTSGYTF